MNARSEIKRPLDGVRVLDLTRILTSGKEPVRRGNQHPNVVPYQVFAAADGHVVVAVGNDAQFRVFCEILGAADLADDPRFSTNSARRENRDEIVELLKPPVAAMSKGELIGAMEARNVPGGEINTVPEVFESEQVEARGMRIAMPHHRSASGTVDLIGNPVKFSRTPVTYRRAPTTCVQHTDEVVAEILGEAAAE